MSVDNRVDVFLSYSSRDHVPVEVVARWLRDQGLKVFQALGTCRAAAAVFVGPEPERAPAPCQNRGAWHQAERARPKPRAPQPGRHGADIEGADLLHVMFNAYWEPLVFELPSLDLRQPWRRWIDTDRDAPDDVHDWTLAPFVDGPT